MQFFLGGGLLVAQDEQIRPENLLLVVGSGSHIWKTAATWRTIPGLGCKWLIGPW